MTRIYYLMRLCQLLILCGLFLIEVSLAKENFQYEVLDTRPHDTTSFTQGLELFDRLMYESSGLYGKSRVRKYNPGNDTTLTEVPLADEYFAEGLTILNDELFLLTWKAGKLFVLNPDDLSTERELSYEGEGWGLANDGKHLIIENGQTFCKILVS